MDTWQFLAGLGLFLYGMTLLEQVLKNLSGRSFKLFLAKYTQRLRLNLKNLNLFRKINH